VLLLLPPSETKRDGGDPHAPLDLARLSHRSLTAQRRSVLAATRSLSRNLRTMADALKLGPSQHFELLRNRELRTSPTLPAIERYTGVLYDALDVPSLDGPARAFVGEHVLIHSAMFGLLGADDPIPAYRLSHDSRLPELSLRKVWRDQNAAVFAGVDGLILDLRSEAYVELGPVPPSDRSFFLRLVSEGADGRRRALNHFNKKGKGEFVRAVARAGIDHPDLDSLLAWATATGLVLERGEPGELVLAV
jgi:cytoplasmic iron level regulating protein YaaA (DUF328/UPF0246 family)